jgi:cytochrome c biogenesis protein CcdA
MDLGLFTEVTGLAFVDAINICALAVLSMVLTTILIQNPEKPKKVLHAGLAFTLAVFVMYLFYGFVIIQTLNSLTEKIMWLSPYLYDGFAIIIMIVGALNIKDFFRYRRGSFATEMPLWMRPQVKKIIEKITSPKGAFVLGLIVTLFLLPCTMMPLMVVANTLSNLGFNFFTAIHWFMYYNFIFVLPMLAIVLIVYFGFRKVDEISGWQQRNIRKLHLIAGIVLFLMGLALFMGWL